MRAGQHAQLVSRRAAIMTWTQRKRPRTCIAHGSLRRSASKYNLSDAIKKMFVGAFSAALATLLLISDPAGANPVKEAVSNLLPGTQPAGGSAPGNTSPGEGGSTSSSAPEQKKTERLAAPAEGVTPIFSFDSDQLTLDNLLQEAMSYIKGARTRFPR